MSGLLFANALFAQAAGGPRGMAARNVELLVATGSLVGVLLGGAIALYLLDRWRKRQFADADGVHESAESLTTFRALYERGELSKEEYEKVRNKMAAKIRQEVVAGQPSIGRPVVRPTPGNAGPGGPAGGEEITPGDDSPPVAGTGSPNS